MTLRKLIVIVSALAALVFSAMPVITGARDIGVHQHHLDHAVLMLLGAIAGLALYSGSSDRESPPWLWVAVLCPFIAMLLMSPSLYSLVDQTPWLHSFDHIVFVVLAVMTAYAGQRYVRGVGWATALMLESMAIVAAFGYGVAPAVTVLSPSAAVTQRTEPSGDVAHGRVLFAQNCAVCHGARGEGGEGPPLKNEVSRKDFAQAQAWIKKPAPPMPALYPNPLSAKDVADVAAFVESLK